MSGLPFPIVTCDALPPGTVMLVSVPPRSELPRQWPDMTVDERAVWMVEHRRVAVARIDGPGQGGEAG